VQVGFEEDVDQGASSLFVRKEKLLSMLKGQDYTLPDDNYCYVLQCLLFKDYVYPDLSGHKRSSA
jgi:hypothetical protein